MIILTLRHRGEHAQHREQALLRHPNKQMKVDQLQ
jgi:hypothetical protein